jgi:2,3-bisphosphoglycerate-independent phosphoglycerate mutase
MPCPKLIQAEHGAISGPVVLVIMDGVGIGQHDATDAVTTAHTPNLQRFKASPLALQLRAHGLSVGMPSDEDMGNSEVGHNAMGAGRIIDQGAKLVSRAINDGSLFRGATWNRLLSNCQQHGSTLHFIGLLSDGNVHSHIAHLQAMLHKADQDGIQNVRCHILLDGRDVPKTSAGHYVEQLENTLSIINRKPLRSYRIASGGGRMRITMDRYQADWSMVERGWHTHVLGEGAQFKSARQALDTYRSQNPGIIDQDLPAFVIGDDNDRPVGRIHPHDSVIIFNFRGDRMLELVQAFEDDGFTAFKRDKIDVCFAGMTLYDGDTHRPKQYLVEPPQIACTLSELLCEAGVTQLACSETQKFGHVTYFWNGNRSEMFNSALERYIQIPSAQPPFDAYPQMRAEEITQTVMQHLKSFRFLRLNFANGDMVGHTGNFAATVKSVETVDRCLGQLAQAVLALDGALVVTADHGNADDMFERDKKTSEILRDAHGQMIAKTSHSLNAVPFYIVCNDPERFAINTGVTSPGLANIAATLATLMGFTPPTIFWPSLVYATR